MYAQWQDDFSQHPWNVFWKGDTSSFGINSQHLLQSKNQPPTTISISRNSNLSANVVWEFNLKLNFKLATNNLARIYLMSNQEDLKGALQGYFVEISGSGTRFNYFLKKQNGTRTTTIIQSEDLTTPNAIDAHFKVVRNTDFRWFLYVKEPSLSTVNQLIGSKIDDQFSLSNFFGVWCKFSTSARSNQFYFDDFKVDFFERDTIPPQIIAVQVQNPNVIRVQFSEKMDSVQLLNVNHYVLNDVHPNHLKINSLTEVELLFDTLQTQNYQFKTNGLTDLSGNFLLEKNLHTFFHIRPYDAKVGDIRINEVMFKPDTLGRLPNAEYVELWNTSSSYIIMNGWKWADKSRSVTLRTDTLAPQSYVILCPSVAANSFSGYGKVLPLSSFPSLNNDADVLKLSTATGMIMDSLSYSDTWLNDHQLTNGGIALEWMGTPSCSSMLSWTASKAPIGGTPGTPNSVFHQSKKEIQILHTHVLSDTLVLIEFNQKLDTSLLKFQLQNDELAVQYTFVDSLMVAMVHFPNPLERGVSHQLKLLNLSNCENHIPLYEIPVFKAFEAQANEILVSEIMVNPSEEGASYVELYNPTQKIFNLKELFIASQNSEGNPSGKRVLSAEDAWFPPQTYLVFTKDTAWVSHQYQVKYPSQLKALSSLPGFASSSGAIWILNAKSETVDKLDYSSDMHHDWLKNTHNVALERISFEQNTNAMGNFISATADIGFGTPTYKNSAQIELAPKVRFWLSSKTLSPDGDGFEDDLEINYELNGHEWLAQMEVYDATGNWVCTSFPNASLSPQGKWSWSPSLQHFTLNQGIYVWVVKLFHPQGKSQLFRLSFAVVYKN